MTKRLEGRVIIITGGSTGIGRAAARRCATEGAAIVIADINETEGAAAAAEIVAAGGRSLFVATDVTRAADAQAMVAATVAAFGRLDGACNNAGIEGDFTNILKMSEANFDRTIAVDLKAVWLSMKYEIEQMMAQGHGGAIVNTASVAGLVGTRGASAYCAAKHGVVGMTRAVALEYARKRVRVNAVCPGIIRTPMLERMQHGTGQVEAGMAELEPVGRLGEPREIGDAIAWLLSDEASFVTGVAMPVDGGYTAI